MAAPGAKPALTKPPHHQHGQHQHSATKCGSGLSRANRTRVLKGLASRAPVAFASTAPGDASRIPITTRVEQQKSSTVAGSNQRASQQDSKRCIANPTAGPSALVEQQEQQKRNGVAATGRGLDALPLDEQWVATSRGLQRPVPHQRSC